MCARTQASLVDVSMFFLGASVSECSVLHGCVPCVCLHISVCDVGIFM